MIAAVHPPRPQRRGQEFLSSEGCSRHGFLYVDRIAFWRTPLTQCRRQNNHCVPYQRWVSATIGILGAR